MSARSLAKPGFIEAKPYPLPRRHPGLTYLDLNECPFEPPEHVRRAVCSAAERGNRYPTFDDYMEVKRLIAEYVNLDPENVVLTAGGDEGLRAVFDVFVGQGDRVVLLEPGFAMTRFYAVTRGAFYHNVRLVEEERRFRLDYNELLEAARGARLVVIENPHNPTGALLIDEDIVEKLLEETEAIILVDEAYYEFAGVTVAGMVERYDRLVVLRTLSKAFCLAGFRIGYLLAAPEVAELLRKALTPFNLSVVQLEAAKAALSNREYVEDVVAKIVSERERVSNALTRLGARVFESYTNFLLVDTGIDNAASKLASRGVIVKPIDALGSSYVRITIGLPEENDRVIKAFEELLAAGKA